jgi:hypothetical protein
MKNKFFRQELFKKRLKFSKEFQPLVDCVVSPRLELGQAEPKTAVLPLHHETIVGLSFKSGAKIRLFFVFTKCFYEILDISICILFGYQ